MIARTLPIRLPLASLSLVAAVLLAASPASAQTPTPKPKAKAAAKATPAPPRISRAAEPTYDEGTGLRISEAMFSYASLEVRGGWPAMPASVAKLAPGASGPEVARLRARLAMTDDLAAEHEGGDVFDANLTEALKRFQARHGLEETGLIGPRTLAALNVPVAQRIKQLAASLDRLATMDFTFGHKYVVVNIPAAVAEAVENGRVVRRHAIIVGKPDRPSPTLTTYITAVNLNPTWTVPLSILKKDIITKMRRDPGYIARMRMRVLDGAGRELNPGSIDWHATASPNFTVRQDSGTWNALGAVRFDMPNPHSVYIHDTNNRNLFNADYRFQSSGCARIENPRDFAVWLLADNPAGWGRREIDAGIARGARQDIRLARKIPVAWIYLTGWATSDGAIHFRDDVYNHDGRPSRAMVADARPAISVAARASGFVLQSADTQPAGIKQSSYLDSQ
jgi:murein L,D-transpeptidase YcbB/YkuD